MAYLPATVDGSLLSPWRDIKGNGPAFHGALNEVDAIGWRAVAETISSIRSPRPYHPVTNKRRQRVFGLTSRCFSVG